MEIKPLNEKLWTDLDLEELEKREEFSPILFRDEPGCGIGGGCGSDGPCTTEACGGGGFCQF
jgi:hypothetical protein